MSARDSGYYTTEGGLLFPSAESSRIDIKPMPEEIGVIPGLYVQADGRKSVTALNEALAARQVRKQGVGPKTAEQFLTHHRIVSRRPRMASTLAPWPITLAPPCRRASC